MPDRARITSPWTRPGSSLPLVRIRHGRNTMIAPAGVPLYFLMHWVEAQDRTQPCLSDQCPHCASGSPRRPLAYCPAYLWSLWDSRLTWVPSIVELPLTAGRYAETYQGQPLWLSRSRPHGPVIFATGQAPVMVPQNVVIEIASTLLHLWRLPRSSSLRMVKDHSEWSGSDDRIIDAPLSSSTIDGEVSDAGRHAHTPDSLARR